MNENKTKFLNKVITTPIPVEIVDVSVMLTSVDFRFLKYSAEYMYSNNLTNDEIKKSTFDDTWRMNTFNK